MRRGYFHGKTILLTEDEWRGLIQRYTYENAKDSDCRRTIEVGCSLCIKFGDEVVTPQCFGCPLDSFREVPGYRYATGCASILEAICQTKLGYSYFSAKEVPIMLSVFRISWASRNDKKVKLFLDAVRNHLLSLQKTKLRRKKCVARS